MKIKTFLSIFLAAILAMSMCAFSLPPNVQATGTSPITMAGFGSNYKVPGTNGDTWYSVWRANDEVYITHNDGTGFGGDYVHDRISRLEGSPEDNSLAGVNLNPGILGNSLSSDCYSTGDTEIDGVLYHIVTYSYQLGVDFIFYNANMLKSTDNGATWTNPAGGTSIPPNEAGTAMFPGNHLLNFVQYGRGGEAPDIDDAQEYVYLYEPDCNSGPPDGGYISYRYHLARVKRSDIAALDASKYEWYTGAGNGENGLGNQYWSSDFSQAGYIFQSDQKICSNGSLFYDEALGRYILLSGNSNEWKNPPTRGALRVLESPHLWGPWTVVTDENCWEKQDACLGNPVVLTKFTSDDGAKIWSVASAGAGSYCMNLVPIYLSTAPVQTYSAKNGTLADTFVANSVEGALSGSYVTGFSSGRKCELAVQADTAGAYILKVRYNTSASATVNCYVNGQRQETLRLGQTDNQYYGSWSDYTLFAWLNEGANTVALQSDPQNNGNFNFDQLSFAFYSDEPDSIPGCAPYEDNLAATATPTVSSVYPGYSAGALIDGVVDGYPGDYTREWASYGEGVGAWAQLTWDVPQNVDKIKLYERPNAKDHILSGLLAFSDGTSVEVGELPASGQLPCTITFPAKEVAWVKFTVTAVKSGWENIGLSEFEVCGSGAANPQPPSSLIVNDNELTHSASSGSSDWWPGESDLPHHNNDFSVARTAGAWAEYTFTGSGVAHIGDKSSTVCSYDYYLDGDYLDWADGYDPSEEGLSQQTIFEATGLPYGTHTFRIVKSATPGASTAGTTYAVIDALEIHTQETPAPGPEHEIINDSALTYNSFTGPNGNGWWPGESGLSHVDNDFYVAKASGAWAEYTFTGSGVAHIGDKSSTVCSYDYYLDGDYLDWADGYDPSEEGLSQQTIFEVTGLPYGSHTFRIVKSATPGASAAGTTYAVVDALKIYLRSN